MGAKEQRGIRDRDQQFGQQQTVTLVGDIEVGRETDGITIDDPAVSRRHLVLRPLDDAVEVEDLDSANGTRIDGARLRGTRRVGAGSTIEIGDSTIRISPSPTSSPRRCRPTAQERPRRR
ncbi:MAG: FHA domain-containing protein [Acidimicrobiales bacterium]